MLCVGAVAAACHTRLFVMLRPVASASHVLSHLRGMRHRICMLRAASACQHFKHVYTWLRCLCVLSVRAVAAAYLCACCAQSLLHPMRGCICMPCTIAFAPHTYALAFACLAFAHSAVCCGASVCCVWVPWRLRATLLLARCVQRLLHPMRSCICMVRAIEFARRALATACHKFQLHAFQRFVEVPMYAVRRWRCSRMPFRMLYAVASASHARLHLHAMHHRACTPYSRAAACHAFIHFQSLRQCLRMRPIIAITAACHTHLYWRAARVRFCVPCAVASAWHVPSHPHAVRTCICMPKPLILSCTGLYRLVLILDVQAFVRFGGVALYAVCGGCGGHMPFLSVA